MNLPCKARLCRQLKGPDLYSRFNIIRRLTLSSDNLKHTTTEAVVSKYIKKNFGSIFTEKVSSSILIKRCETTKVWYNFRNGGNACSWRRSSLAHWNLAWKFSSTIRAKENHYIIHTYRSMQRTAQIQYSMVDTAKLIFTAEDGGMFLDQEANLWPCRPLSSNRSWVQNPTMPIWIAINKAKNKGKQKNRSISNNSILPNRTEARESSFKEKKGPITKKTTPNMRKNKGHE